MAYGLTPGSAYNGILFSTHSGSGASFNGLALGALEDLGNALSGDLGKPSDTASLIAWYQNKIRIQLQKAGTSRNPQAAARHRENARQYQRELSKLMRRPASAGSLFKGTAGKRPLSAGVFQSISGGRLSEMMSSAGFQTAAEPGMPGTEGSFQPSAASADPSVPATVEPDMTPAYKRPAVLLGGMAVLAAVAAGVYVLRKKGKKGKKDKHASAGG
jgi:hypothetical protein